MSTNQNLNLYRPNDEYVIPIKYTEHEGGAWIDWKGPAIRVSTLDAAVKLHERTLVFSGIRLHSLLVSGATADYRWDCLNGWTEWGYKSKAEAPALTKLVGQQVKLTTHQVDGCAPAIMSLEMLSKPKVPRFIYIASPYTHGDPAENVRKSLEAANILTDEGFVPFCPLLCHFWHFMTPKPYKFWTEYDLAWIERCDGILRLPGYSKGADAEVKRGEELGLPIWLTIGDLLNARYPLPGASP